jgi:VanZ family protein
MGIIFLFSAQSRLPRLTPGLPDLQEIGGHIVMYFVLALLWLRALRSAGVRHAGLWTWAIVVCYGITDEFHQGFVPGRTPSRADVATDALAGAAALFLNHLLQSWGGRRFFPSAGSAGQSNLRGSRRTDR